MLGLESGGGVHEGNGPLPQGMLAEVFVELLEYVVPKWDPARKGRPLGEDSSSEEENEDSSSSSEED